MTSRQQFSPLCDVHHTAMLRMMQLEDGEATSSYHACERRDCKRVFRDSVGYSDLLEDAFDESRTSLQTCPHCGSALYLAEVDHARKVETWECPQTSCDFSQEFPSPSGR